MRKVTIAVLFLAILLNGFLYAEEGVVTCIHWNAESESSNLSLVWGWLEGIKAALALSVTTSEEDEYVYSKLWPKGHRVESVVMEMDVECRNPVNREQTIQKSLKNIAVRLNSAREVK